jgi:hypothetical protein
MTKKERDDCLSKEIGYGAVEHSAQGADSIVEHTVQVAFPGSDKVAFQGRGVRVTETDCITVICPYVVEDTFDGGTGNIESELRKHSRQDVSSESGLDDICSIQTIDAANISECARQRLTWSCIHPFALGSNRPEESTSTPFR